MTSIKPSPIQLNDLSDAANFGAVFKFDCDLFVGRKIAFETPVRFQDVKFYGNLSIGAYSFMRSAYVSGSPIIGRYCSLGSEFSIGEPDHPTDWLGTSPFQYERTKFFFHEPMRQFDYRNRPAVIADAAEAMIGNDVWIGSRVMVLKGVKIGDGAIVAAGAIVTRDVDPYTIVGGVPAKLIRNRFRDSGLVADLKRLKWWEFMAPDLSGIHFENPATAVKDIDRREAAGTISRRKVRYDVIRRSGKGLEYVKSRVANK